MTKKIAPLSIGIVVVAIVSLACGGGDEETPAAPAAPSVQTAAQAAAAAAAATGGPTKIKAVGTAGSYKYEPAELAFNVGETIEFAVEGDADTHTFTVDELEIDELIDQNETHTFSVTFSEVGTFKLYCIPHPEMIGTITVQ